MSRFILRYSGAGTALPELTERLREIAGIKVLDSSARMFLLEGKQPDLDRVVKDLTGWQLIPESFTPLPDPRPKLGRRSARAEARRVA